MKRIRHIILQFKVKAFFFALGIGSLAWFLFRVIPKPSRAAYPCMRAAAPVASSFVLYLLSLTASAYFFKKAGRYFKKARYYYSFIFIVIGSVLGIIVILNTNFTAKAAIKLDGPQAGNEPIGNGKGIFPGRVVWEHHPGATDEFCLNEAGDYWSDDKNTNQQVVNYMLSDGLQKLTGTTNDELAWDSIFHYYNREHGRGNTGYQPGEKISIKINLNGLSNSNDKEKNTNTSPQVCYAILDQLVNNAGVAQSDISIGDQKCPMDLITFNKCHEVFPGVIYWGERAGMVISQPTVTPLIQAANGSFNDKLPQAYVEAAYLINIPVLKKHHRAGISISSKNHFGSLGAYTGGASHLHPSLPCSVTGGINDNGGYGKYRCFVDIMGHKDLGGKTILYLVDGLWGSTNWGHPPIKWGMNPFYNDWPNSLFLSQDPVAIESVCFDFLYEEFDEDHPTEGIAFMNGTTGPYPHLSGTDDYLHQAADPSLWPNGLTYDPENDGTILTSMGVHEHWNNPVNKQYTRNLGNGSGIELVSNHAVNSEDDINIKKEENILYSNIPNPFNQRTLIRFKLARTSTVIIKIYNSSGQLVITENLGLKTAGEHGHLWNAKDDNGNPVPAGNYICSVEINHDSKVNKMTNKITFIP